MSDEVYELELVAIVDGIYCRGRGRRDVFVTDPHDQSGEWVSSLTCQGNLIHMVRDGNEIWVPLARVREMRPKAKKAAQPVPQPTPQPAPVEVKAPGPVAVVVPIAMPDEKTPEVFEGRRKAGRPKKAKDE